MTERPGDIHGFRIGDQVEFKAGTTGRMYFGVIRDINYSSPIVYEIEVQGAPTGPFNTKRYAGTFQAKKLYR